MRLLNSVSFRILVCARDLCHYNVGTTARLDMTDSAFSFVPRNAQKAMLADFYHFGIHAVSLVHTNQGHRQLSLCLRKRQRCDLLSSDRHNNRPGQMRFVRVINAIVLIDCDDFHTTFNLARDEVNF